MITASRNMTSAPSAVADTAGACCFPNREQDARASILQIRFVSLDTRRSEVRRFFLPIFFAVDRGLCGRFRAGINRFSHCSARHPRRLANRRERAQPLPIARR